MLFLENSLSTIGIVSSTSLDLNALTPPVCGDLFIQGAIKQMSPSGASESRLVSFCEECCVGH